MSCPRLSAVVCPGPVVVDEDIAPIGACGTVVAVLAVDAIDGSDVPLGFVAVTENVY
jgi:hypothetical protein